MKNFLFAIFINAVIIASWLLLLVKDRKKGIEAVKIGAQTVVGMLPLIVIIICSLGVVSSFISPEQISNYLGDRSGIKGFFFISIISSFLQIPGIIAFPIAATLKASGASVSTVAVFASASTMASILTFPVEIKYLGKKLPFIRMGLTYLLCVVVGLLTGYIFRVFL